jgi:hypothetical protein
VARVASNFPVKASAPAVFNFIAHPPNFRIMWPSMIDVYDLRPSANGGTDWSWTYRMLGMRMDGRSTVVDFVPYSRIAMRSEGSGLCVNHEWNLTPRHNDTVVQVALDFLLPVAWLTAVAEPLFTRENRHQAAVAMATLRRVLETGDGR